MPLDHSHRPDSAHRIWIGRLCSVIPVVILFVSAAMKLMKMPEAEAMFSVHLGWPVGYLSALATLEIACTAAYIVPRSAVLGAVLLTGYLGGAIATHVRVGDPFTMPLALGILVWLGLYLRDLRIPELLPLARGGSPL